MSAVTPYRDLVERLENQMLGTFKQFELPVRHHFSKGVYARELFIPKGVVLTGKIHKHENLNIISAGDISVLTEEGVKRIRAPHTLVSPAGTKRVGYAHEDTVWTTIHGTDERDLDKIEGLFIAASYDEYLAFVAARQLEAKG